MIGVLFSVDYTLAPYLTGLYTSSDPSVFVFRDASDSEKAQLHQRLLRAADVVEFHVVARDHAQGELRYRGAYKRVVPFVCEGAGKGLLLRRMEGADIMQAGKSMKRLSKVQLENHFNLPTDPLSVAKLVFFQHLFSATRGTRTIVHPPVPTSNISLFDPATKRLVRSSSYYKSLLLDETCFSLPPAERHHMAMPPQLMYTEQKMHTLRLRLDRPESTTIILDSDADSDTSINLEQLTVM